MCNLHLASLITLKKIHLLMLTNLKWIFKFHHENQLVYITMPSEWYIFSYQFVYGVIIVNTHHTFFSFIFDFLLSELFLSATCTMIDLSLTCSIYFISFIYTKIVLFHVELILYIHLLEKKSASVTDLIRKINLN